MAGQGRELSGCRVRTTAAAALSSLILAVVIVVSLAAGAAADSTPTPGPTTPSPSGPSPSATAADNAAICADVEQKLSSGKLDELEAAVKELRSVLPAAAADSCIARETKMATQAELSLGQEKIRSGNLDVAEQSFTTALRLDTGNVAAQQGLAQVAEDRASVPTFNWNTFYATRVEPAYRIIGAFLIAVIILFVLSAQTSRFLIRVDAVAWPRPWQTATRVAGSVLIVGMAVFLPIYPMFKPFDEKAVVPWWSLGVVAGILVFFATACWFSYRHFRTSESRSKEWACRRFRRDWLWPPSGAIAFGIAVGTILWFSALTTPHRRLLITYFVLVLLGVILTGTSFGQLCRLQVQAMGADGQPDAPSTDYLLARLRTLGMEQTPGLNVANLSSSISSLQEQDLSGIPGGKVAGALAKILFALRPDLTWQAQVTIVDEGRAAIRLSRNGRLAFAVIFSQKDLGLGKVAPDGSEGANGADAAATTARSRAQLLSGAAAAILTHLSLVHPRLREGLCGAKEWRSVALQVIASSESLGEKEDRLTLLRKAVNMDPGNAIARFEYIRKLEDQLAAKKEPYDRMIVSMYDDAITGASEAPPPEHPSPKRGWESFYLKLLYNASVASVTLCVERLHKNDHETQECLNQALGRIADLSDNCKRLSDPANYPDSVVKDALDLEPFAQMLEELVKALRNKNLPNGDDRKLFDDPRFDYPKLSFNSACLKALTKEYAPQGGERAQILNALVTELAFATATDDTKAMAVNDSYLQPVRNEVLVTGLVRKPRAFLDLEPFAPFKTRLAKAQLTDAKPFAEATLTAAERAEMARFLKVPDATVDRLHRIAAIGAIDPDLNADMLQLFLGLGIDSPSLLRKQLDYPLGPFKEKLRLAAEDQGLSGLIGVKAPRRWIMAVRRLTCGELR